MAAPAYGTSGAWSGGSASTRSYSVPASVASGDIIVIEMFMDGSTVTISAMAAGFAHAPNSPQTVNAGGGGNHSVNVVWKRASASDTGTYDFTFSASAYVEGQAHRYTGCVGSGSPWDVTTSADGGATSSNTTPAVSVTTTGPDRMLFFAGTCWAGGSWTPPTGMTERTDNTSDVTADDLVQATQGSSGNLSATCSGTDKVGAWLGALIGTTSSASGPVAGPWTSPAPGLLSPTGQLRPWMGTGADLATAIGLTDTGSGADAPTVTATVPITDGGSAADTATVSATVPISDSGTGADAAAITATIPLADAGSAADALAVTATVPLTESGAGADAITAGVPIALADTGTAADTLTVLVTLAQAEAGSALDALGVTATVPLADPAAGSDAISVQQGGATPKALADAGAARDRIHVLCLRPNTGTTTRPNSGITYYQ